MSNGSCKGERTGSISKHKEEHQALWSRRREPLPSTLLISYPCACLPQSCHGKDAFGLSKQKKQLLLNTRVPEEAGAGDMLSAQNGDRQIGHRAMLSQVTSKCCLCGISSQQELTAGSTPSTGVQLLLGQAARAHPSWHHELGQAEITFIFQIGAGVRAGGCVSVRRCILLDQHHRQVEVCPQTHFPICHFAISVPSCLTNARCEHEEIMSMAMLLLPLPPPAALPSS